MRVAIVGYGSLGHALKKEIEKSPHELVGVFTSHEEYVGEEKIYGRKAICEYKDKIDTVLIATSSLVNAETDTAELLLSFNTVDSFDVHKRILKRKSELNAIGKRSEKIAIVSAGWDPGLLSVFRALAKISVASQNVNTFWGYGKSLGHTSAIKRIAGVKNAVQYTCPIPEAAELARASDAHLCNTERHRRICYVAAEDGADKERIKNEILGTKEYFEGYDTEISFISESQLLAEHSFDGHSGEVIATGDGTATSASFDLKIKMQSNPAFTAKIMISYLNAINCLQNEGKFGAFTPLDIPLSALISQEIMNEIV